MTPGTLPIRLSSLITWVIALLSMKEALLSDQVHGNPDTTIRYIVQQ